ncbi:MAG: Stp1/IreP family PP2C-type Ser/Thr phosphatase [Clostridia bacterium]|nr:Stp1/IreP family PP2C-type Ser/Thr phosphatase [Clostridia bacterium]
MRTYARTDIGPKRPVNEDSYRLPEGDERFAVVADGMGGHQAGEVASAMAVEAFASYMNKPFESVENQLKNAVLYANGRVWHAAQADPEKEGMGTTLTAVYLTEEDAFVAHVGDSRAYLMRNGVVMRITEDHTLVEELVLAGKLSPAEARVHPQRNLITRALGAASLVDVDVLHLDHRPGDVWLLCSDGLSSHLTERQFSRILRLPIAWQEKVEKLVDTALENGSTDNITCVIVTDEEAGQ